MTAGTPGFELALLLPPLLLLWRRRRARRDRIVAAFPSVRGGGEASEGGETNAALS